MTNYSKAEILKMVEDEGVEFIRLQFTGIFGVLKVILMNTDKQCVWSCIYNPESFLDVGYFFCCDCCAACVD